MDLKEIKILMERRRYKELCEAVCEISPRVFSLGYFDKYVRNHFDNGFIKTFQDDLKNNVSAEYFQKWRSAIGADNEDDYLIAHNLDLYTLSEEEKRQACLVE